MKIKEIKKGDRFLCIKDVVMNTNEDTLYFEGCIYVSERDGHITNSQGEAEHSWSSLVEVNEYFKLPEKGSDKDPINKAWHEKFARPIPTIDPLPTEIKTPEYYDNSKGSLYQIGLEQGWNSYQQDLIKRISRCEKKGEFFSDLNKTKSLIDLYIKEQGRKFEGNK